MSTTTESTESRILWDFVSEDSDCDNISAMGTESEANKLLAVLNSRTENWVAEPAEAMWQDFASMGFFLDVKNIADILTDLEISNTIANNY